LACAAGITVLETLQEEDLINHVKQVSSHLVKALKSIPAIKKIKGRGLMLGLEFDFPIADIREQLLTDYQIFTGASANPNLLRILPPLNITVQELTPFITALNKILS